MNAKTFLAIIMVFLTVQTVTSKSIPQFIDEVMGFRDEATADTIIGICDKQIRENQDNEMYAVGLKEFIKTQYRNEATVSLKDSTFMENLKTFEK